MLRQIKHAVAALLLASLLAAGCSGDDEDEVASSGESATTTSFAAQETTSTLAALGGGGGEGRADETTSTLAATAGGQGPAEAPAPAESPTSPQAPAAGVVTNNGAASATPRPAGETTPTPVAPGTYTYAVTGSARSSAGTMDVPPESRLVVHPAQGTDQRQSREAEQGSQEQVLRFAADGTRLVRQTFETPQGSKDFRPEPPVLAIAHPIAVNQTWAWEMRSTDGATTVKSEFTALRQEDVVVGGETVSTWVLRAQVQTSGDVTSTIASTIWYSPRYRLAVQTHANGRGSFSGFQFESDTTEKLVSVTPA